MLEKVRTVCFVYKDIFTFVATNVDMSSAAGLMIIIPKPCKVCGHEVLSPLPILQCDHRYVTFLIIGGDVGQCSSWSLLFLI